MSCLASRTVMIAELPHPIIARLVSATSIRCRGAKDRAVCGLCSDGDNLVIAAHAAKEGTTPRKGEARDAMQAAAPMKR